MKYKMLLWISVVAALSFTGCANKEVKDDGTIKEVNKEEELTELQKGMSAVENGFFEEAVLTFRQAIAQDNENLELLYRGLGIAYMGQEDYEQAIEAFDEALVQAGAQAGELEYDISYYKASAMVRQERLNDALDVYNRLVDYKPEIKTYVGRGAVYARMGNMDMARADFDTAITMDAKNYDLYIEIFQMLDASGRNDIGQEYLKKALGIDKEQNKNNLEKGKVYYYLGQLDKAKTELEKIKEDAGEEGILFLAKVYEELGDFSYAQTLYMEYLEKDSSNGNIYNLIAVAQVNAGDLQGALAIIQEGIEKASHGRQELYRNEIAVYEQLLDFSTAKVKMEEYLASYPEDEEAAREYIFIKSRSR